MAVSGATQLVRAEWRSHTVKSAETGLRMRSCQKTDELRRRYEESERRCDAAGVPLEARPRRVDELPPGEVAGSPTTETAMEEQASRSTELPMRIVWLRKEQQKSLEVADKPRDPRQTCQSR